jgi:hypothetical protein
MTPRQYAILAAVLIIFLLGMLAGYALWHQPAVAPSEPVRHAAVQKDGSVLVARVPVANPGKAPHIIPKGAKEERRITIVVTPNPITTYTGPEQVCSCAPVSVDLSVIRGKDGTGVIASSPDGTIDARESVDTPIIDAIPKSADNSITVLGNREGVQAAVYSRAFRLFGQPVHVDAGVIRADSQAVPVVGAGWRW